MRRLLLLLSTMISASRGFHLGCTARCRLLARNNSTELSLAKSQSTTTASVRVGDFWQARMDCWRPTIDDVERISWGKPAKKKGTGSRGVPHRLNEEERLLFDQARRKGFLEITGSGWRSQRREAPLLNSYRSLCDARGQASIVLHKGNTGMDELVVDISPLRTPEMFHQIATVCQEKYEGAETVYEGSMGTNEFSDDDEKEDSVVSNDMSDAWENRPIYQLPPYCIAWQLQRSDAKALGKEMVDLFLTKEGKKAPSKKPLGVKPGKGRRHGGYGIG